MFIGCHVSISGGVQNAIDNAVEVGCECFQIFTQNQRQWKSVSFSEETIAQFRDGRQEAGFANIPVVSHASYLINMCAWEKEKLEKSRTALRQELERCDALGVEYMVIHPGSHGGKGEEWGIATIAESINRALKDYPAKVSILLETTAGQGKAIGHRLEHLRDVIDKIEQKEKVAVCGDTCHMFAAGFPFEQEETNGSGVLDQIDQIIGMDRLKAFHLNDSLYERNSRKDRHAAIGKGYIGRRAFESLVNDPRLKRVPGILEVPGGEEQFKKDIALLKSMRR